MVPGPYESTRAVRRLSGLNRDSGYGKGGKLKKVVLCVFLSQSEYILSRSKLLVVTLLVSKVIS